MIGSPTPSPQPQWTSQHLGLTVTKTSWRTTDLVIPGLRRNPRRAHLLVSTVLGKHIPTDPNRVREAADALADHAAEAVRRLAPTVAPAEATVFGFAETATGLGHGVAVRLGSRCYLQSTRRSAPDATVYGEFTEGHSHATLHLIQGRFPPPFAERPSELASFGVSRRVDTPAQRAPLILVDDEISTGATAIDAIRSLHAISAHPAYVVASLVDMRSDADCRANTAAARDLGVDIEFVALANGSVTLPDALPDAVSDLTPEPFNPVAAQSGAVDFLSVDWPADVPDGGRFGFHADDAAGFTAAVSDAATLIRARLREGGVVVVGHEELMYLPQRIAQALAADGHRVGYQTTTRSPAVVLDEPGYPLRRGFEFVAPEPDSTARRYLYNATLDAAQPSQLVLVVDTPADTAELRCPGGVLDVLTRAGHDVLVVVVAAPTQAGLRDARARRQEVR
ncbi:phosphoribosyltransferase [Gordonia sp. TBRC 11910]|uniref:Phosphoribosyltransferase n=1 Tax=Gordonia asplenii TaxID=2725283 RepID=A0A848KXG4_9ACTN|nr:phosphoribosyltransferase family protein [Gordonia asplenii]NMO03464.1 phosphoribosyltransferase [Gordonia asplenii]